MPPSHWATSACRWVVRAVRFELTTSALSERHLSPLGYARVARCDLAAGVGIAPTSRASKTRSLLEQPAIGCGPGNRTPIVAFRARCPAIERGRMRLVPAGWNRTSVGRLQGGCPATERCRRIGVVYGDRTRHGAVTARRVLQFTKTTIENGGASRTRTGIIPLCRRAPSLSDHRTVIPENWRRRRRIERSFAGLESALFPERAGIDWLAPLGSNQPHSRVTAGRARLEC
jgi:hypothetical protein